MVAASVGAYYLHVESLGFNSISPLYLVIGQYEDRTQMIAAQSI